MPEQDKMKLVNNVEAYIVSNSGVGRGKETGTVMTNTIYLSKPENLLYPQLKASELP
jgi:hypothetical protein